MSVPEGRAAPLSFGRYKDPVLLGQGGMGAVYRATDPQLDRFVAVKVLTHREPKYVERFRREAQVLAKIMHPSIIQIYEIVGDDDEQGDPYIVMEYFEGKPLDAVLKMSPLPQLSLMSVIYHTAEGLKRAHANNVIHRDIKPANLMMSASGEVKILDFGIAKALDAKKDLTGQTVLGTPYYMSPEQAMGQTIDARTDVYSLGITAFHLLTGKRPFEAKSKVDVMLMQVKNPLPDIRQLVSGVDERVVQLIEKMTAKQPGQRFQSCQELIDAIDAFPKNLGGRAPEDPAVGISRPISLKASPIPPASSPAVEARVTRSDPGRPRPPSVRPSSPMMPTPRPSAPAGVTPARTPPQPQPTVAPAPQTPARAPSQQRSDPRPERDPRAETRGDPREERSRRGPPPAVSKPSRAWVGVVLGALGAAAAGGALWFYFASAKGAAKAPWRVPTKNWVYPGAPAPQLKLVQSAGGYGNCVFSQNQLEEGKEDASTVRTNFSASEEMSARCYFAHQVGPSKAGEIYQELWVDGARRKQVIYDPPLGNTADLVVIDIKQEYGALLAELGSGKHTLDLWLYRQSEDADNPEPLAAGEFTVRK